MSEVKRAVQMAQDLIAMQAQLLDQEAASDILRARIRIVEQEELPELMRELELTSFELEDGSSVSVTDDVQCGITEANRPSAHGWLIEHGFGGLIKAEVKVAFDRGDIESATQFAAEHHGELKDSVHPSTLKSFIKERLAAGDSPPQELFNIHPFNRVKIAAPKGKPKKFVR